MTKLVLMSDTHGQHRKVTVPDGDILIHAGDFSFDRYGQVDQKKAFDFFEWYGTQPHRHKILIAGNHDYIFERSVLVAKTLPPSITYLEGESVTCEGLNIWGGPWTPRFFDWAFNVDRGKAIKRYWDHIPNDTDILVTHGPPMGTLDLSGYMSKDGHVGCEELALAVERVKPMLHVFGHIHTSYGKLHHEDGVSYVNAALCDMDYNLWREPVVVDITKGAKNEE